MILRQAFVATAFIPRIIGNNSFGVDCLAATGAIALSHPFELARVLIVNSGTTSSTMIGDPVSTLRAVFQAEGVAGLFRGFTPRAAFQVPIIVTLGETVFPDEAYINNRRENRERLRKSMLEPIQ